MQQNSAFKILAAFLLIVPLMACVTINEPPKKQKTDMRRFHHLMEMNDLNERGFAYHKHCLQDKEPLSETYLDNFKVVSDELFDECVQTLKWKPEFVVKEVLKRRDSIQRSMDNYYGSGDNCHSAEADMAGDHYRAFSSMTADQVKASIDAPPSPKTEAKIPQPVQENIQEEPQMQALPPPQVEMQPSPAAPQESPDMLPDVEMSTQMDPQLPPAQSEPEQDKSEARKSYKK